MRTLLTSSLVLSLLASCSTSSTASDAAAGNDTGPPLADTGTSIDTGMATDTGVITGDGGRDLFACTVPSDCVVSPRSCCGNCGTASPTDLIGVRDDGAGEYRAGVCGGNTGCPACAAMPDPQLVATCTASRCMAIDLRTSAITACTMDSDCRLRFPTCCECGGSGTPIAIAATAEPMFSELVCDPLTACADCLPTYAGYAAVCRTGRCVAAAQR